jgi:hypothetical protein
MSHWEGTYRGEKVMPFPKTLDELKAAGYRFENDANCRGCGDAIEWYTTPNGKKIPMNAMDKGTDAAIAHWSSCTEADSFRKDK